jgi:hypothetical protein
VSRPERQDTSLSQGQRAHFSAKRSRGTTRATTRPDDTLQSCTRALALRSTASTPATEVEEGVRKIGFRTPEVPPSGTSPPNMALHRLCTILRRYQDTEIEAPIQDPSTSLSCEQRRQIRARPLRICNQHPTRRRHALAKRTREVAHRPPGNLSASQVKAPEERRFAYRRLRLRSNFVSEYGFIHLQGAIWSRKSERTA